MNPIWHLLRSMYQWNQPRIWGMALIAAAGYFIPEDDGSSFIGTLYLMFFLLYGTSFYQKFSLFPSSAGDSFSFKYLASLPISRPQLFISFVLFGFIRATPFIFGIYFFSVPLLAASWSPKALSAGFLLIILIEAAWFANLIRIPRLEFFQKKYPNGLMRKFHWFLFVITGVSYFAYCSFRWGNEKYLLMITHYLSQPLTVAWNLLYNLLTSWWLIPVLMGIIIYSYHRILFIWQHEKSSYPRRLPTKTTRPALVSLGLLAVLLLHTLYSPPLDIIDNRFLSAVYRQDYTEVKSLLIKGEDVDQKSSDGTTGLYLAVNSKDLKMYKLLEQHQASKEILYPEGNQKLSILSVAIKTKDHHFIKQIIDTVDMKAEITKSQNHPLILASVYCLPEVVDYLIEKGADIHVVNQQGSSALHAAAQGNCMEASVSLLERGIDPYLKTKTGKTALDVAKHNHKLAYFLQKKMRAPASKP